MKKFLILFLVIVLNSCGVLTTNIDHFCSDWQNPCTNSQNCEECEKWKKENPKEYKRYLKRVEDYQWVKTCE